MGGVLTIVSYFSIRKLQHLFGNPQKSFTFSSKSKEQLVLEYNGLNAVSVKYFYIQLLSEIENCVLNDDEERFKTLNDVLNYVIASKSYEVMQKYEEIALEAVGKMNLITLACKIPAGKILGYLLTGQNVNFVLPFRIDKCDLSPEEEDEESHNAFYYAIRSNVTSIFETLIAKWPNSYFKDTQKLDDILSKAFHELSIRNVPLTKDMEMHVKKKLVELRFFHNSSSQKNPPNNAKDFLMLRIEFVLEKISFVVANYCGNKNELDEEFLLAAKFVVQNIHTLKSQLNFTYDKVPWEEMEFCLVIFLRFCLKAFQFEPLYYFVLNKQRLLSHLEKFSKRLECVKEELKTVDMSKVPNKKNIRKQVMEKEENKIFEDLYNDFTQIRDLYTLEKIKKYTNIALSADPRNKEGHILITRALQVTGEHLNNTPTAPKLSDSTSAYILSILPKNVSDIITSLRNSLSHLEAFCLRSEIEENANTFFDNIQADIAKISSAISEILYKKKIAVIIALLKRMINHESIDSMKIFVEQNHTSVASFKKVLEEAKHLNLGEIGQLEKLVSNLEVELDKVIIYSRKMFLKLHDVIEGKPSKISQHSPDVTSELCDSLVSNGKTEIMKFLKHAVFKVDSASLLTGKDCFVTDGKIDIDKVNEVMVEIFLINNLTENKVILNRIKEQDLTTMWKFFPQCDDLLQELPNEMEMAEYCKPEKIQILKKFVSDIESVIERKSRSEKEQLRKILNMIADKKLKLIKVYEELSETLKYSFGMIQTEDKYYSSTKIMRDICNFHKKLESLIHEIDLKSFSDDLYLIAESMSKRMLLEYGVRGEALEKALLDLLDFVVFRMGNIKWIEEFKHMIHIHKKVKPYTFTKNVYTLKPDFAQQLTRKILLLRSVLQTHNLKDLSDKKFQACEKNKELQILVEMLVLDILSVIEGLKDQLTHINFYLDTYYPTAYGRNLRNHIAHGNALVDMILGENFENILLNAQRIIEVKDILQEKLGKKVENDPVKSKKSHENDLSIMKKQKQFFVSLAEGSDIKRVKDFLSEGVDIYGRDLNSSTALHFAARAPNPEILKFLLKFNLDVNARDDNHQTVLHIAANSGMEEIVEYLIDEMKMPVNAKDINGKTPLHIASKKGHEGVVKLLLKHKANALFNDVFGYAPLHYAVLENHFNVVTVLLENEIEVDDNQTFYGFTGLHLAAEMGHLNIVNTLLEKGVDVNFKSDMDYLPLHSAASGGHSEVVKSLLKKGADVNAQNVQGLTPLHLAVDSGDVATIGILLQHGAGVNATYLDSFSPFYIAAEDGNFAVSKILMEKGAAVAQSSRNGVTPLDVASYFGHCELVEELLNVADTNSKILAMQRAASRGHLAVVELILKSGVNVEARSVHVDSTVLHFAAEKGHADTVKFLLNRGADINAQDGNGDTALHLSSRKECKEVVKLLIEMKADILIKDKTGTFPLEIIVRKGMTDLLIQEEVTIEFSYATDINPFHCGAYYGDINFVSYCIQKGCDVDIRTESGLTALHMATIGGREEVIHFLLTNGSDINAEDQKGCTALKFAVSENNKKILELLIKKGANLSTVQERSLFLSAVEHGHENIVDFFLSRNSNVEADNFKKGEFPLHMAVIYGHISVVKKMLEKFKREELNVMDEYFRTPLLIAAVKDHCEIAQMLLSKGADPDISSKDGKFPLLIATSRGNYKMVEILLSSDVDYLVKDAKGKTSIELAIESRQANIVEVLLQNPQIRNIKGEKDCSLLHTAVYSGSLEIIESLIVKNVNINSVDSSGAKPIHIAAKEGYLDILEYFLNLKIAVDERGENDWTLIHYAAAGNHSEICKFLFEKGADVNAVSSNGATPLHIAAEMGHLDALLTLLEVGAFYNACDKNQKTPLEVTEWWNTRIKISLMFASNLFSAVKSNSRFKLVGLLMAGLDILKFNFVNVKNANNTASIHYAAWKGYERIVNILLSYRANPNSRTKNGWTSLHYAAKFSHYGIIKDLLCNGAIFEATSDSGETPLYYSSNAAVITLLEFVKKIFHKIENKDRSSMDYLKAIEDMDIAKAALRAKNLQYRTLTCVAIINDHPDTDELKEIFQTDVFIPLKMAEIFYRHGNCEESFNLYQEVLQKRIHIFDQDDPAVLDIQKQIASLLVYYRDYNGGLSLAQKVHKTLQSSLGDRNRETLIVKCLIASTLECMGQEQQALKIYEEVSEKQREVLGLNHRETLATLTSMAELLQNENKFEIALKINGEIFKTLTDYYEINPWALRVQTNIATILLKQEKFSEALEMFRDISAAKEKIFGFHHQETLETSTEIAVTLLHMGLEEESLKLFRKNVELQLNLLGPNHPDTLRSRRGIANILFSQRKFCEALDIYTEDLNARILRLGANHPSVESNQKKIDFINSHIKKPVF